MRTLDKALESTLVDGTKVKTTPADHGAYMSTVRAEGGVERRVRTWPNAEEAALGHRQLVRELTANIPEGLS